MLEHFLSSVNYWAVLVSGLAYWIIGAVWFSALFGSVWGTELENHGVKIKEPTPRELAAKLVQTFGVAFIVFVTDPSTVRSALGLGAFTGVCLSGATLGIAYTWEGRSKKLFLVDAGYPIAGVMVSTIILSVWK
jgi:hypothetical protein